MATVLVPGLRRLGLVLRTPSKASICSQCLRQVKQQQPRPSRIVDAVRARTYASVTRPLKVADGIAAQAAEAASTARKSSFPETNSKVVGYWLLGSAVSVFGIVVFGGLTRLTESGYDPSFLRCLPT